MCVYEKLVLRAWRYGEPHQGTAPVSVCRPHQLFADARQSVAAMFFLVRICADAGLAATGIERYAVHQRTMLDVAGETFKNRCTSGCHRPPGVVFMALKTIHGSVNSHELWPISNKCRYAHHLHNPQFTLHDDHGGWS